MEPLVPPRWPTHPAAISLKGVLLDPALSSETAHLNDIEAGSPSTPHIDRDRLHQRTLGKVLYLLRHGGTEE